MPSRSALLFCLTLIGSGCRTELGSAIAAYDAARYPEAVQRLRSTLPPPSDAEPQLKAQYALYRGLAELSVGDARAADQWLRSAWAEAEANPDALDQGEYGRLTMAWRSMGRMPAER